MTEKNSRRQHTVGCFLLPNQDKFTYICGFINERKFGNATSSKNLKKTLILMGKEVYQRCVQEGISTKWTNQKGADRYKHWHNMKSCDYFDS
jgi:hypothetical protein